MKKIIYISPSTLPSRTANSIHVINMVKSLSKNNEVELYARTAEYNLDKKKIISFYGIENYNIKLNLIYYPFPRFIELFITLLFLYKNFFKMKKIHTVISRNLLSSFVISFLFKSINNIHETHSPEVGLRAFFQKKILSNHKSIIIVISKSLKNILIEKYKLSSFLYHKIYCFHDAAPIENIYLDSDKKKFLKITNLESNIFQKKIVGYFGNLYKGRGKDLIYKLAKKNPSLIFIVFGSKYNFKRELKNLIFIEFVPPHEVISLMKSTNILLMPYEKKVFLSDIKNETSKWMSPLKMFEYMSSGIPFISSDIPVLREVLQHEHNCLLAKTDDVDDWHKKINILLKDKALCKKIIKNSTYDIINKYNWDNRSHTIINLINTSSYETFSNYVIDNNYFLRRTQFITKKFKIFSKNYIIGNFKFYIKTLFGGINFEGKKVLDIGGGVGVYSIYSSLAGAREVITLEPETDGSHNDMIKIFDKIKKRFNCQNVKLINKKIQDFKPINGKFDIVIMHNAINHLDEYATLTLSNNANSREKYIQIFDNLRSILNDDAKIIITDCSSENFFGDLRLKNPFAPQIEWEKHSTPKIWKQLLLEAHFKKIKIKWINHSTLRSFGLFLFGNKYTSYFLNSYFLIKCQK